MSVERNRSGAHRLAALFVAGAAVAPGLSAQQAPVPQPQAAQPSTPAPTAQPPVAASALDAELFYRLLVAEIELRTGQPGNAYQLLLDTARRSREEQVFRRATDIALASRAGDQALAAATAWRQTIPASQNAIRYQVQLLVALNRTREAEEPLATLLASANAQALPALIDAVPRLLVRSADRQANAELVERVLAPYAAPSQASTATRATALAATARAALQSGDTTKALTLAEQSSRLDPPGERVAALALEMVATEPAAEAIVERHLQAKPSNTALRLAYVRALAASQRFAKATTELDAVTRAEPALAPPWLTLGAIELERKRPAEATAALETYIRLIEGGAPVAPAAAQAPATASPPGADDGSDDDGELPTSSVAALTQARLMLAQAAEQAGDWAGAERQLSRIDNPERALQVQARRASLLAKQNRLGDARELIRRVPEQTAGDVRAKYVAEAELLRERKLWSEANGVLAQATRVFPDDPDLLYEQAMLDEKQDRVDEMEKKLRRVIELRPDHHHAYNALGYSLADRKLRLEEARALIAKALELSPNEPFITDSLGWVEYRLGNREEAIRLLRRAYNARPDAEIAAHLGEVLWAVGQRDEARRIWREGRQKDATNDVLRETLARLQVDL